MGNLKFFKWSKILITYSQCLIFLLYEKKNWKKLKEDATETKKRKTTKNSERYKLSGQNHHPPLQKFDFGANFLNKSLPRCPQILCKDGWCKEMWQKSVFRIFKYFILFINGGGCGGGNYTFQKQLFFTMLKKKPKNLGRGLKSWGIVENGLYFENIKKREQKN